MLCDVIDFCNSYGTYDTCGRQSYSSEYEYRVFVWIEITRIQGSSLRVVYSAVMYRGLWSDVCISRSTYSITVTYASS